MIAIATCGERNGLCRPCWLFKFLVEMEWFERHVGTVHTPRKRRRAMNRIGRNAARRLNPDRGDEPPPWTAGSAM